MKTKIITLIALLIAGGLNMYAQDKKILVAYFSWSGNIISTLADAISDAGLEMEFILFDDCYMSSVEVAYDLRHVTGHIIPALRR